jgi:hypothetical protein
MHTPLPRWVINRLAQPEHFASAFSGESRRFHAAGTPLNRTAAPAPGADRGST